MSRKLLEKPLAFVQRFRTQSADSTLPEKSGYLEQLKAEGTVSPKRHSSGPSKSGSGKEGDPSIWYVDTETDTSLPDVTNHMSSLAEPANHTTSTTNEKKAPPKIKPKHTIEYKVTLTDTLASIAAQFDTTPSELIKLNKLVMRTVFPGQVLYVPDGTTVLSEEESSPPPLVSPVEKMKFDVPLVKMADKPPAKVPGHVERQKTVPSPAAEPTPPHKLTEDEAEQIDRECYERFIKINVKQITDGQGVVSGTLLVTPNAVMFDPNVSDPLVIEHGAEKYGMITPMDMVMSAAMYHDIAAMKLRGQKSDGTSKHPIYHAHDCPLFHHKHHHGNSSLDHHDHPDLAHNELSTDMDSMRPSRSTTVDSLRSEVDSMCSCGALSRDTSVHDLVGNIKSGNSTPQKHSDVPSFEEESQHSLMRDPEYVSQTAENVSVSSPKSETPVDDIIPDVLDYSDSFQTNSITSPDVTSHDAQTKSDISKDTTDANNSIADGQTDLESVKTEGESSKVHGSDANDASVKQDEKETESKDVPKSESDSKVGNNAEADVVAKGNEDKMADEKLTVNTSCASDVPSAQFSPLKTSAQHLNNFVNYATGLFRIASDDNMVKDVQDLKLDQTDSKQPTLVVKGDKPCEVENAIKLADKPDLFQNLDTIELIPKPLSGFDDPPLYLCLRVGQPKFKEVSQTCPIESYRGNKKKPEYWFSIPREKVDQLYAFFVQWTPDIYGDEEDMDPEQRGFVVFDEDDLDAESSIQICDEHFASIQKIRKDWEIVSKVEAIRRMSTVDIEDTLPLPDLVGTTTILTNDDQIQQLSNALPPRTIGYPWTLVYSSENHGFSLKTLYRNMHGLDSPVLIVVEDTNGHVFGALTNCPLKMSDHFYGTGESFLYTFYPDFKIFHWSGENNFFLKGNQESLAIGSGQGYFGLWFDGDLYHGRSQRCDTFDNDILTEKEDFCVKAIEAWAFV